MKPLIFYAKPSITDLEVELAADAVVNGWGDHCYDYINKFEQLFKAHLEVEFAIATSSCTGALHMGLSALGIKSGDEVIMADTNWIATAAPVIHLGAKPVFIDILPDTWCLNPRLVEEAITPRTKAIIAVHLYGNLCDMDELLSIGHKYNIPVIEDAAEAIGSVYKGRRAGSMGIFGTFSFHGSKTISTGEGGMLVTNNPILFEKVSTLNNHGRKIGQYKQFWPEVIGFKYKMSNLQAAIGCAQVMRITNLVKRKKEILNYYKKSLSDIPGIVMNLEPEDASIGAWMPTIVFEPNLNINLEKLKTKFKNARIDARDFFPPLSSLDMFISKPSNIHSYSIYKRSLNLPSYHDITNSQLDKIIEIIKNEL